MSLGLAKSVRLMTYLLYRYVPRRLPERQVVNDNLVIMNVKQFSQ